jgi:uncharacterized protein YlxW (UPF0749 family)
LFRLYSSTFRDKEKNFLSAAFLKRRRINALCAISRLWYTAVVFTGNPIKSYKKRKGEKAMTKKNLSFAAVMVLISFLAAGTVRAASKDMEAGKRTIYQDDSTESMRDVYVRLEAEEKEYKQKMLAYNEESIALLKEIRDLLRQPDTKE